MQVKTLIFALAAVLTIASCQKGSNDVRQEARESITSTAAPANNIQSAVQ